MELVYVILAFALILASVLSADETKHYIVLTAKTSASTAYTTQIEQNLGILGSLNTLNSDTNVNTSMIIYNYNKVIHGFAAQFSLEQAKFLVQLEGVEGVYEDTTYNLLTTYIPEFLGLKSKKLWKEEEHHSLQDLYKASQDVIIGILDTGVWPQSPSFNDYNLSDIPSRWNGSCEAYEDFDPKKSCNKKLIGARCFSKGMDCSPLDKDGHGTHTASTAAGSRVLNASLFDYARGNAQGMSPGARLSVYRVCSEAGCSGADILAGIEAAVHDGVDVLSMSLGGTADGRMSLLDVATFRAMERGIFVSCSAGNSGPTPASVVNGAPWTMAVGAGSIDRDFPGFVTLGNGTKYKGVSLYSGNGMGSKPVELVYGGGADENSSRLCLSEFLDADIVRGKMVICDRGTNPRVAKGRVVKAAGGVGMILANAKKDGGELLADSHFLPAVAVTYSDGEMIKEYVKKMGKNARALFTFGGTVLKVGSAPQVASFSSRGPSMMMREILKPDIIAPGLNILAGWPEAIGPSGLPMDDRKTKFNILSGTSMSCPHISGLAALLKAAHPKWSPSAIKSALMTTAYTVDNTKSLIHDISTNATANPLAYGSGHVNILRAMSPGFVYDAKWPDYIGLLCSLGIPISLLQQPSSGEPILCPGPGNFNYPSFSVFFNSSSLVVNQSRIVTNVGSPNSIYNVSVLAPPNVKVTVKPSTLVFKTAGDKQKYNVTFELKKGVDPWIVKFGSITWLKRKKYVRSPVVFYWM